MLSYASNENGKALHRIKCKECQQPVYLRKGHELEDKEMHMAQCHSEEQELVMLYKK